MKKRLFCGIVFGLLMAAIISGCGDENKSVNNTSMSQKPESGEGDSMLQAPDSAAAKYSKYLPVDAVEYASGMSEIKLVPKNSQKDANGDLNFATNSGKVILTVKFQPAVKFQIPRHLDTYEADIGGVGDEAFIGPKGLKAPVFLMFRNGDQLVTLTSYGNAKNKSYFSKDRLIGLAKTIENRL